MKLYVSRIYCTAKIVFLIILNFLLNIVRFQSVSKDSVKSIEGQGEK